MAEQRSDAPRPGRTIDVECHDLDRNGHGLARWNGWVIVVPDLLPGETAQVQLQQRQRSRWLSRRVQLQTASTHRRRPPCILSADCGGCTLQALDDHGQSQWKSAVLVQTLQRIAGHSVAPEPLLTHPERCIGYRNRALIPLKRERDGRLKAGYYRARSHRIVNLNQCPVLDPRLDALIQPLKSDLDATGWPADHDLHEAKGLRHLGLRLAHHSGDVLITLVSSHDGLPDLQALAASWMKRWPTVKGVCLNLQPKANNLVLGPTTKTIVGVDTINEQFCGVRLALSSTTFFQVNTLQAERIVNVLRDWLNNEIQAGPIVDAYCGIGTISLPLAMDGFDVRGIELHAGSIEQARLNAMNNGLSQRCRFVAGDVAELLAADLPGCQALVLDPPRRGLDSRVVNTILAQPPPLVAYLSCDPATLARDLKALLHPQGIYQLERVQPVDFFPQTTHLETLVLLRRLNS